MEGRQLKSLEWNVSVTSGLPLGLGGRREVRATPRRVMESVIAQLGRSNACWVIFLFWQLYVLVCCIGDKTAFLGCACITMDISCLGVVVMAENWLFMHLFWGGDPLCWIWLWMKYRAFVYNSAPSSPCLCLRSLRFSPQRFDPSSVVYYFYSLWD